MLNESNTVRYFATERGEQDTRYGVVPRGVADMRSTKLTSRWWIILENLSYKIKLVQFSNFFVIV